MCTMKAKILDKEKPKAVLSRLNRGEFGIDTGGDLFVRVHYDHTYRKLEGGDIIINLSDPASQYHDQVHVAERVVRVLQKDEVVELTI